tara:strand:- start:98 stop:808 length:711 start_codon:yes stop_codon:yes gene_type:complete
MGFLDHSTNNIIVDAVLTDTGRQALSRNDGSFSIFKFALADDEIDYAVIQQYGRTVGKEKIEKNTPVLEALTLGSLSMKYPLASVSNEFLTHLPVIDLSFNEDTTGAFDLIRGSTSDLTATVQLNIQNKNGIAIEDDLKDAEVHVELNDLFLTVQNQSPDFKYSDNTAVYRIGLTSNGASGPLSASFVVSLKSFSDTTFNTYSTVVAGETAIRTFMKVTGINSGASGQREFRIKNT